NVEVSSDPFNIYGLLNNGKKDNGTAGLNTTPPFPPGFTPEVHQQGHYDNGNPNVDNRSCGFKLKEGGSILDILDEMIKFGQTMDVKSKTTEDIIGNKSFMEVLVLNNYVLVKNVLKQNAILIIMKIIMVDLFSLEMVKVEYLEKLLDESQVLLRVPRKDNIYNVDLKSVVTTGGFTCLFAKATTDESNLWNMRLGYINYKTMNKLVRGNLVRGLPSKIFENNHGCVACQNGKQHKASYKAKLVNSITKPLHMLHMDLFGPTNVKSLMKKSYCLVITDDFSRFSWVFFLATKDETDGILKTFITGIKNQLDCKVKVIRALVIKPHNKTPYELIHGRPPLIDFMKPFGYPVTILNTRDYLGKFDEKADEGFFIGVAGFQTNGIAGTKDNIIAGQAKKKKKPEQEYILIHICTTDPLISQGPKDSEVDARKKATEVDESQVSDNDGQDDQVTRIQILKDPSWVEAMQDELLQFKLLKVWTLVDLPKDKWAICTKWVFRNKNNERGIMVKNKARLVAQGHTQEEGIDCDEVFAPVARIEAIQLFLTYTSFKDFIVYQMYVKSAFLYVKIEEEVYVCQPPGFEDPNFPDKVYKVEKALCGLHQAPRACQEKYVADILKKFDFTTLKTASTPIEPNKALVKDTEAEDYPRDSPFDLEAYSDSDYAGASLDRKSTTGDETVYKGWEDKMKRAATTASSLEAKQDSGEKVNGQEQIQALVDKQKVIITEESIRRDLKFDDAKGTACLPNDTIFEELARMGKTIKPKRKQRQATEVHSPSSEIHVKESISTPSNDPLPSGEDSIQLNELMIFYTNLQQQVLDLEEAKTAQAKEISNLKKRVKKLEKRRKSRPVGLRRLNKGRSIEDIDQDAEIALVDKAQGRMHDADMFGVDDLKSNAVIVYVREKIVEKEVSTADPVTTPGEVVTAASVEDSVAPTTATTVDVDDELTLAKTLIAIKAAKPKVISTAATTVTTAITTPRAKGIIFHEQVQAHIPTVSSSKDKGKAKMIESEKPLKKKDQIALDEVVARKLEAEMKAKMEKEERIARETDEANKAVTEECSKRAGQKLEQENAKKQKLVEQEQGKVADDDTEELKRCLEIVLEDDDDVAIEATPLSCKYPTIVDYKIYREGKKSYFKIIRADENSQNYLTFGTMFENFNREDLEVLKSIVKEMFKKTKPVDDMDNLLFQTVKTMFEPHVEDIIWKYQQGGFKVNNWKLFNSCGVYCVITKTMVYYLLVEKMYQFTNSILHQLWSDVRLQVDYEVEMAYDFLRLIRRQINKGYKHE
nr:retrovirus-related Pol polyprotein from transposon TNT 1-94 [Tanacetum cinerariifolium]